VAALVTFVIGSATVVALDRSAGSGADRGASPTAGASPSPEVPAVVPVAYLVWVPGGFPGTTEERLTTVRPIAQAAVATAGVGWLTRSADAEGTVVDAPADPPSIPVEVTGIDPGTFAGFLPEGPARRLVAALGPREAILSRSSAKLRGLGAGATLTFAPGVEVEVAGVLPDVLVGAYEVVLRRATAERIGVDLPRYALLAPREGASPTAARIQRGVEELLATATRRPIVEVRAPGETELLRAHDRSLPPIVLKQRYGEFAAAPATDPPRTLVIDPEWMRRWLRTATVPRLGTIQCHRRFLTPLRRAMRDLDPALDVGEVGACFDPSWRPDDPQGTLPPWLWGAAIRISTTLNQPGTPPLLDARIVEAMQAHGFRWAGRDAYPDGSLFEALARGGQLGT
jgi:hypothetical protein